MDKIVIIGVRDIGFLFAYTFSTQYKLMGISTEVYCSIHIYLQECMNYLVYKEVDLSIDEKISKEIMSFSMNHNLEDAEIDYIFRNVL